MLFMLGPEEDGVFQATSGENQQPGLPMQGSPGFIIALIGFIHRRRADITLVTGGGGLGKYAGDQTHHSVQGNH